MIFDPLRIRAGLLADDQAMLRRHIDRTEASTKSPLGNTALSDFHFVTRAWLVGLHKEVEPIVPRALAWLDRAIEEREVMGECPSLHQRRLHWARAMGKWMQQAVNAQDDWAATMALERAYWIEEKHPIGSNWVVNYCLDDYMACAVQAGRYADGIQTYESLVGAKKLSLGKVRKPRDYAYALCLQQVQARFDEKDLFEAGRRVLQANLDDPWLGRGQSLEGATWLKIVYWDSDLRAGRTPALTPLQTILKAYENMPGVPVPDFVHL